MSAVSTKLIPASSARSMMRIESSWSGLPQAPNIIVPRQSFETWTPVRPSGRYSTEMLLFAVAGLGVVDDLGVGLGAELLGVRAAADPLVERVARRDLLGGQREVEDIEVLGDAVRLDRLRDRAEAAFDVPAQDDLRRGLAVLGREIGDDRIGQRATRLVGARHVDQDAVERRPRLGQDGQLGVGLAHGEWIDRIIGLENVTVEVVMARAPDGSEMFEIVRFHSPSAGAEELAPAANRPGLRHVAFKVDDVRGVVDRVREAGWETVGRSWTTRTRSSSATSTDPKG